MTRVFDFHTHILPGIDDGSRSAEESLAMVRELLAQGASGIAATPHFYAQSMSPDDFFARRQCAWEELEPCLGEDAAAIRMGAEVHYFEGIHRYDALERFRLEGTELLLLEMPECAWTARMVDTVLEVNRRREMTVLLAHIERYLTYHNRKWWEPLLENGVLMQASTAFFIGKLKKAIKLLREGKIHFLGTDAHNMGARRPDMAPALETVARRGGEELLRELTEREAAVLGETEADMDRLRHSGAAAPAGVR